MTEHSLEFFKNIQYELKQEYRNKIKALGIKDMTVITGWEENGEYEINILFPQKINDDQVKKVKTLFPKVYKTYKVIIILQK